jgi:hypothetical protein
MRLWILGLCCFGLLGGGACSARPLLDISLTTKSMSGLSTRGYPHIDVTRTDGTTPVKDVDKTDGGDPTAIFTIDDTTPTHIGVYLPSGTEGDVEVSAEIVAMMGDCDLTCAPKTVSVHGGDVTSVSLTLTGNGHACAAQMTDAGTDAANDARVDANGGSVLDTSMGPDSVSQAVNDCLSYCGLYLARCPNNVDAPTIPCVSECTSAHWTIGLPSDLTGQDTFSCRVNHLRPAADKPLDCSECSAGSPASPGVCGSPADAARDACPLYP